MSFNKIGNVLNDRQTAIDKQIEQWVLIGPLLMLGALLVLFLTPIRPVLLTSVALIGLPICWKWRIPAAAAVSIALIGILIYEFAFAAGSLPYWHIGFALTVSLTLWITAFASLEVEHLFSTFQEGTAPPTSKTQIIKNELALLAKKKGEEQRAAEAKIANLELLLSTHEKQLLEQSETSTSYIKQFNALEAQNAELKQKLSEATLEASTLRQSISENAENLKNEQRKSDELLEKCSDIPNLVFKIETLEKLRSEESEIWESSNSTLVQKLNETEDQLRSKDLTLQDNIRSLSRIEEQNAGLLQEIFQRRHECTRLKQQAEELREELLSKSDVDNSVNEELTLKLNAEIEEKQAVIVEQQSLIENLQNEIALNPQAALESQLAEALLATENVTQKFTAEIEDKQALIVEQQSLIEKLQNEIALNPQAELESQIAEALLATENVTQKFTAEIEAKQNAIQALHEQIAKLQNDLDLNHSELTECRKKAEELVTICAQKEQLLVEQIENAESAAPDRKLRKLEGLYKQLKEQFADKSELLDMTRQELFVTNEALVNAQRQQAEKEFDSKQVEYLKSLEVQLEKTNEELISVEKRHIEEIDALQTLIKNLSPTQPTTTESSERISATPQKGKSAAKERPTRQTKTTNWANAILSRCAEPTDQKPAKK